MKSEKLYNWVFHYNPYTKQWAAYHRDDHKAYFNAEDSVHPIFKCCTLNAAQRLVVKFEQSCNKPERH